MDISLLQFLGSLAAVLAIVALAYLLGFRQPATLSSEAEARALFRLAAGGFEPAEIGLDADGRAAIARDGKGQLAVLVPHGNQFVVRHLDSGAGIFAENGVLVFADLPSVQVSLGEAAKDWATTDIAANSG